MPSAQGAQDTKDAQDARDAEPTLRERKRDRTRKALVAAALDLFERRGYDGTTVADIAEAADIGTRTFFSYFASKEELLFPDRDARVQAARTAIASKNPEDTPVDVLLRGLRDVGGAAGNDTDDLVDRAAAVRLRIIKNVPAVRGRALLVQLEAQRDIATELRRAFPEELDEVTAMALVGAFVGAVNGALVALLDEDGAPDNDAGPATLRQQLLRATDLALRPWRLRSGWSCLSLGDLELLVAEVGDELEGAAEG